MLRRLDRQLQQRERQRKERSREALTGERTEEERMQQVKMTIAYPRQERTRTDERLIIEREAAACLEAQIAK